MQKRLEIFISYARDDREYCTELLSHLGFLINSGQVNVFDDSKIRPGEDWNQAILEKLDDADIVVCLISPSFQSSPYCTTKEMISALERKKVIIPVLIRDVDFEGLPISKYQAVPVDENNRLWPIARLTDKVERDRPWSQVARAIRNRIPVGAWDAHSDDLQIANSKDNTNTDLINNAEELEHIGWSVTDNFIRNEQSLRGTRCIIYIPKSIVDRPAMMIEIDRSMLDIKDYALSIDDAQDVVGYFIYGAFIVTYEGERIISAMGYIRSFFGGAHSTYDYKYVNFDKLAKRSVSLGELLDEKSHYNTLTNYFEEKIRAEKSRRKTLETDDIAGIRLPCRPSDLSYCLVGSSRDMASMDCVRLLFAPYEVGSFAEGPYEVDLPAASLVEFGTHLYREICDLPPSDITGSYVRQSSFAPAYIRISQGDSPNLFDLNGEAYWNSSALLGPNIGTINFTCEFDGKSLVYSKLIGSVRHEVEIHVRNSSLIVNEDRGPHGHNVTFSGQYVRQSSFKPDAGSTPDVGKLAKNFDLEERSLTRSVRRILRRLK
ncbi:MAG: toll/interleukin-1 receptor domain-containing protein [Geminicoccaceae bacterium]